ncbi:MAG: hypothetical protein HKN85_02510, partial [Gammaproteobacteria bacterium]|nr:hypothetical protein [Gammaproteobacteria bacterium]
MLNFVPEIIHTNTVLSARTATTEMNPMFKYLPLLMNSKLLANNKKWLALAMLIVAGYQLF